MPNLGINKSEQDLMDDTADSIEKILESLMLDRQIPDDSSWVTYRVRILKDGAPVLTVFVTDYDEAVEFARIELESRSQWDDSKYHAALVESGHAFLPFLNKKIENSYWHYNGELREGIVQNTSILKHVDTNWLFGLTKKDS
jgi:hypothetical protein